MDSANRSPDAIINTRSLCKTYEPYMYMHIHNVQMAELTCGMTKYYYLLPNSFMYNRKLCMTQGLTHTMNDAILSTRQLVKGNGTHEIERERE